MKKIIIISILVLLFTLIANIVVQKYFLNGHFSNNSISDCQLQCDSSLFLELDSYKYIVYVPSQCCFSCLVELITDSVFHEMATESKIKILSSEFFIKDSSFYHNYGYHNVSFVGSYSEEKLHDLTFPIIFEFCNNQIINSRRITNVNKSLYTYLKKKSL